MSSDTSQIEKKTTPEKSLITSNDPSVLIQDAFLCLENNDTNCALKNCNRVANVLEDREMTSLCGTLFDPSIAENNTITDPRHAYRYYLKAKQLGGEMAESLGQLSDWLINHQQFSTLGEEIQTALNE